MYTRQMLRTREGRFSGVCWIWILITAAGVCVYVCVQRKGGVRRQWLRFYSECAARVYVQKRRNFSASAEDDVNVHILLVECAELFFLYYYFYVPTNKPLKNFGATVVDESNGHGCVYVTTNVARRISVVEM